MTRKQAKLTAWFEGPNRPELRHTVFWHPNLHDDCGQPYCDELKADPGDFQWCEATQALGILLVEAVFRSPSPEINGKSFRIEGSKGSPAYALWEPLRKPDSLGGKKPSSRWPTAIFGYKPGARALIEDLIKVQIERGLYAAKLLPTLSPARIEVWWDGKSVTSKTNDLRSLAVNMRRAYFPDAEVLRGTGTQEFDRSRPEVRRVGDPKRPAGSSVAIDEENDEDFALYSPEGQVDTRLAAAAIKRFESYALVSTDGERASFGCMPKKVPQPIYTLIDGICLGLAVRFAVTTGLSEKAICEGSVVPLKQVRSKDHVKFHHTIAYFLKLAWIRSYQLYKIFKYDSMAPRMPKLDLPKIRAIVEDVCDCNGNQLEVTFQQVIALHLKQKSFMAYCAGLGDEIQAAIMPHLNDLRVLVGFCFVYGALAARAEGETDRSFDRLDLRHYDSPTVDKLSKKFLNFDIDPEKLGDVVLLAKYGVAK